MTNIKTMMEEIAQEELERDVAACREVMQSRKRARQHGNMRLIDADALMDGEFPEAENEYQMGWNDGLRGAMIAAPTVDAVEVVHGRWIPIYHTYYNRDGACQIADEWRCSECKVRMEEEWNYCPNCGRRMDGRTK